MTKRSKTYKPSYLFNINDNTFMALDKQILSKDDLWSVNFGNYDDSDHDYSLYADRQTLKRMAEFILKYLENN